MKMMLLAAALAAAAPDAGFDAGVDAGAALAAAKEAAAEERTPLDAKQVKYRAERDCATFSFAPEGPELSEAVWLRSTEYEEVCDRVGDPRRGGGVHCREVPRWTNRERVQLELKGRQKLFPWERESFEVCLEGRWLNLYALRVSHEYKAERRGGSYTLLAGARKPSDPDKHGVQAGAPATEGAGLSVTFTDRWAAYYPGETVRIKFKLKREVEGWFDPTLVEKEVAFPSAESYKVDLSAFAAEFSEKLKPGKKYYVEYGFSRIGKVSKPTYMKAGDGPAAVYAPAGFFELARKQ